jgi:DNA polymerase elongation subunit (family B)
VKIAYWDIECWDLAAPFGPLLCASVLLLPEDRMITFRQDKYVRGKKAQDMLDDRQLCCDLRDLLEEQHITSGWYSKGFDISHLNSRLAIHGERLLKAHLHLDAIWFFKGWRGIKLGSAKMKTVAKELGLKQKPDVGSDIWMAARVGNRKAMDEVADRCEADVEITRQITERALDMGLVRNIQRYP